MDEINTSINTSDPDTARESLIVIAGPTATGKTSLSVSLAKRIGGEIISADSMQVYRHMDIGSAKITEEEMQGVPHHLIDILDPTEDFNILLFQKYARQAIREIRERGHIPILAGGTGFYIQAVTRDIDFTEAEENSAVRSRLEQLAEEKGSLYLHEELKKVDPESAEKIHPNNIKRVIRALEFYELNQFPISAHNAHEKERETPFDLAYFVLDMPRDELYTRIDLRVDQMLESGLVREVEELRGMGCSRGMTSMQGLGYKEILGYLEGETDLDEAVRVLKRDTRHFAKRQLTWFRREKDVLWIEKQDFDYSEEKILAFMLEELRKRKIIPPQK